MFTLVKEKDKAVLTMYGYVGGYYLDYRNVAAALEDITRSKIQQVDVHLHTNGGSVFDGNLIYNFIASFKGNIDIYIDGIAASMGAVIIMAANRVHIAENGFIMIHNATGDVSGNAKQLVEAAKLLRSIERNFVVKLADKTGKTLEEIQSTYFDGNDHWIDADDAIKLGLVTSKFTAKNGNLTFTKSDAVKQGLAGIFDKYTATLQIEPKPDLNMKRVNMKLKLDENATEEAAVSAIEAIEQRAVAAEQELSLLKQKEAEAKKAKAALLVSDAIKEQRIGATAKSEWLKMFEDNFEQAEKVLKSVERRTTAKDVVESDNDQDADLLKMTWDEADKAGRTVEMKQKYPDVYKEKYKATFGKEPKI